MRKKLSLIVLTGILRLSGFSQDIDNAKLNSYFEAIDASGKFMGSVAVSQNGKLIYTNSVGFADKENQLKANENSKYRIGSISKTFTAVIVLKAIEENKLTLTETIEKYFPTIKNAKKITIGHLLQHRSGIHNFTDDEAYLSWNTQAKTEKEMVKIIAKGGSDFKPDRKAAYSNSNYVLLTYILEKSLEKPYATLLEEYIIQPVGLKNTYLGGKINPGNHECNSYYFGNNWTLESETDISIPLGAGGIVSTPSDLVKFSDALFNGTLIDAKSLEQMKSLKEDYGIALFQMPFYDKTGYGHTGGIDGFSSVFAFFPDGNISIALLSNGNHYNMNNITLDVLSAVYNMPYEIPEFNTIALSPEELDLYLGIYTSAQNPLKITISKDHATLMAQATGQSSFPLEATAQDKFKFDPAGVVLEFNPTEKTMILKQGGAVLLFTKQ